jgi:hypothetical protein
VNDAELVQAVIQRDEAALDIFHERYEPTVRNSLYRKFGEVNEDYRQEAWLNIFDNLSKLNDWRGSLASFVWQYSGWGVGRLRADKSLKAEDSLTQEESDSEWSETDHEGWLEWREGQDFCDSVPGRVDFDRMLMRKENTRDRAIYLLVKVYGMSCSQVAIHFNVSDWKVKEICGEVGQRSTKDLMFITDGKVNQMIGITEKPPAGFWIGRTTKPRLKDPVSGKFVAGVVRS